MTSLRQRLAHASVGSKLALLILILMMAAFLTLGLVFSSASARQVEGDMEIALKQQQRQVTQMLTLFDTSMQASVTRMLSAFLATIPDSFSLDDSRRLKAGERLVPVLRNAGIMQNSQPLYLDNFTQRTGAPVSLFVRDGDDFIGISTSLQNTDGSRMLGFALEGKVLAALRNGQSYSGLLNLADKHYMTRYQPIEDEAGNIVGASFIGVDIGAQIQELYTTITNVKWHEGDFSLLASTAAASPGRVLAGDQWQGTSLLDVRDDQGRQIFAKLLDQPQGQMEYRLPGETGTKVTRFEQYPAWDWVVATTVDKQAITADIIHLRNLVLGLSLLLALAVAGLLYWLERRLISRPLDALVSLAQALARGDLSQRITSQRQDEIGKLTAAMNSVGEDLSRVVGQVRGTTGAVNQAAGEIAQGNEELSARTEQSASSLQETSASMEEITTTVQHSADSAQQASQLVNSTSEQARRGNDDMRKAQASMEDINRSAERISEIISLIDGIAFQTNILALNASVEAARAGEHGRGFAVVAQEVRTLATRSSDASREIRGLIDESISHTQQGVAQVKDASQAMAEILSSVERVNDMIAEISAGAREQSAGVGQVNTAVSELDAMTQQNTTLVNQVSGAARSMSAQAQALEQLMAGFKVAGAQDMATSSMSRQSVSHQSMSHMNTQPMGDGEQSAFTPPATASRGSQRREEEEWEAF
ncbi:Cache 3/Cache 2 fusion domain-containing protein [Cobetia sp. 4B]|uniref:methyl-accepting chemotaxis protein n=1 Tax=Cobetia sp. 4B TaxID=2758724 RepID=UPI001C0579E4|nr:Cache 3/Cache 2 fusion domain-containing protein [Cobetia sp. 4B]QWN38397.1 Cache 3/Cache 2 fusion domain-containing protein [Cobetia sp. 4B]